MYELSLSCDIMVSVTFTPADDPVDVSDEKIIEDDDYRCLLAKPSYNKVSSRSVPVRYTSSTVGSIQELNI